MSHQTRMLAEIEKLIRRTFELPEDRRSKYTLNQARKSRSRSKSKKPTKQSRVEENSPQKSHNDPCSGSPWSNSGQQFSNAHVDASGLGFLAQQVIHSADRLVAFIDITDEQRQQEVKMYIHQRERLMCWLDRHLSSERDCQNNGGNDDAIDEEVQNQIDCLQRITSELLRELSRLKLEVADKQQQIDELEMENDALARDAMQVEQLWKLEATRMKLEKEKRFACQAEVCSLKSLLRKISYYEQIEQYFWVLEEHSRVSYSPEKGSLPKIEDVKQNMQQKIMNHASQLGYALASSQQSKYDSPDKNQEEKTTQWHDLQPSWKVKPLY